MLLGSVSLIKWNIEYPVVATTSYLPPWPTRLCSPKQFSDHLLLALHNGRTQDVSECCISST